MHKYVCIWIYSNYVQLHISILSIFIYTYIVFLSYLLIEWLAWYTDVNAFLWITFRSNLFFLYYMQYSTHALKQIPRRRLLVENSFCMLIFTWVILKHNWQSYSWNQGAEIAFVWYDFTQYVTLHFWELTLCGCLWNCKLIRFPFCWFEI